MQSLGLVPGERYRRRDLHKRLGGQQQGGISTPANYPIVLLFSTSTGHTYGYDRDGWRDDGLFDYTGEGQRGQMELVRGNAAIANHAEHGEDLLVFVEDGDQVRFEGQMVYVSHREETGKDVDGQARTLIVFTLARAEEVGISVPPEAPAGKPDDIPQTASLPELRRLALERASQGALPTEKRRNVWQRSQAVRRYALLRAAGRCEGCLEPAPFALPTGEAFLEVHHLHRLSDGGPDHPDRVAAVCPNCHRRAHLANDAATFNAAIMSHITSSVEG